ncbi:MAG: polysaccharide biosynthesis/export family protein [Planctomycetota bacterium]
MRIFGKKFLAFGAALTLGFGAFWLLPSDRQTTTRSTDDDCIEQSIVDETDELDGLIRDDQVRLCQGFGYATANQCGCHGACNGSCGVQTPVISGGVIQAGMPYEEMNLQGGGFGYGQPKSMLGVDDSTQRLSGRESKFRRGSQVPFDQHSFGGYVGPHRTPHVPEYRLRVDDQLEFVYIRTREKSLYPYQLYVGDIIEISSGSDTSLNQTNLVIRSDGKTSFSFLGEVLCAGKTVADLQRELNEKYTKYFRNPTIVVQVRQGETPLQDIVDSVDARQGQGGQSRQAQVSPDGTIQLPAIGSVPAVGLTLNEIAREVNARYRLRLGGIEVTPILLQRAPSFIYVVGEVGQPGRVELTGPTSAIQAIALAQGFAAGGNIRQIIVLRRDQNWQLTATKLDLAGALYGKRPQPSDEIWLQRDDIILVPKKPITRLSEAVNQYLSNTLYQIFPQQGVAFNFDDFTPL